MRYSVIIPAYNCPSGTLNAYRSLADQGEEDLEIIIVDDGSTDETPVVIKNIASADGRVRPVFQKNAGPAAARNTGLKTAEGDYILFLDCDDTFRTGLFEKIADAPRDAKLIIFGFSQNYISTERRVEYIPEPPFDTDRFYAGNFLNPVWNKVFKRDWLISSGIFFEDLRFGEDRIFSAACVRACENPETDIYIVPEVLYNYNVAGNGSLVSSWYPGKFIGCARAYDVFADLCSSPEVPSYMFIKNLLSCITVMFSPGNSMSDVQKLSALRLILNDDVTRRALEESPAGGPHIKLLKTVFQFRNPRLAFLAGKAVYFVQQKCLPIFIRLK